MNEVTKTAAASELMRTLTQENETLIAGETSKRENEEFITRAQNVLLNGNSSVADVMKFINDIDSEKMSPNMQTAIQLLLNERDLRTQFMSNVIERMFRTSEVIANNI